MSEMVVGTENEICASIRNERPGLPDTLRNWLVYPDALNLERESIQMHNEWLQAERDEIVQYVRTLKKLALHLNGKNAMGNNYASRITFEKAEKDLPDYLRKEVEVSL
jgi:hypothetical protein